MGSEWVERAFSEVCTITRGASPRPIHDWMTDGDGIPWIKISDATASAGRTIEKTSGKIKKEGASRSVEVSKGDLILSNSATPGIPRFVGIKACIHDGWMLIRNLNGATKEYLYYLLEAERPKLVAQGNGSVFTNLKTDILKNHRVSLPPIQEQKAIAHILGTLDDKIELNRKTNETLEAMAKALFKSWFVDFDPVRAKAEGRPTGLPAEISDLFPDSFDDSELGEIPSGWRVGCLSDCCEITMGQSPPGDTYNEDGDGLPFYQGKTDFGFRFPGRRVYCSSPTRQASIGATLISVRAPVGSANIAREVCSIGRGIAALKSRQSADSFIYYLIGTLQGVFESYNSEGTVFGAINGKDLASIQVVAPSTEAIAAFNSQCLPMDESIQSNTLETEHLTTIRDALLPKLISGEIRIPDAERMLEEVGI
jgi:type I restriction enzyme, S subunit